MTLDDAKKIARMFEECMDCTDCGYHIPDVLDYLNKEFPQFEWSAKDSIAVQVFVKEEVRCIDGYS